MRESGASPAGESGDSRPVTGERQGGDRPAGYSARFEADVVLRDGKTVTVRPILPGDAEAIRALHARLSPETRYLRFFSPLPQLSEQMLARFTQVDYADRFALVALLAKDIIGVGRYDRLPGSDEAEVAFVVDDAHQGRGLGTLLLEHLALAAREAGIRRFVAETLPHNQRMLAVFADAGFAERTRLGDGVVHVAFDIAPTAASVAAMHERERRNTIESVRKLLAPRSVAVVGASRRRGTVGQVLLRNILAGPFTGPTYPVHPTATSVGGVRAYPSVLDIPDDVNLAVVAVPAEMVETVAGECAAKGVGALVVVSAGFAEEGEAGAARERSLVRSARRHGMRVLGPGSMGIVNTAADVSLNATVSLRPPLGGTAALLAQSGALGLAILEEAFERGLGISTFVSTGNKADISGNDLLHFWESDPQTDVVLLYLESFGNPRTFSRVARRVSRTKPIVAVRAGGGRSVPAGWDPSRAGPGGGRLGGDGEADDTAAATWASAEALQPSEDEAIAALFRHTGVVRVDTLEALVDVGRTLATQPLPAGRRVAILSHQGGPVALAVDSCLGNGLELARPTGSALSAGSDRAEPAARTNPVTLPLDAPPSAWGATLERLLDDPDVDAVLACFVPTVLTEAPLAIAERGGQEPGGQEPGDPRTASVARIEAVTRALAQGVHAAARRGYRKPVVANVLTVSATRPADASGGHAAPAHDARGGPSTADSSARGTDVTGGPGRAAAARGAPASPHRSEPIPPVPAYRFPETAALALASLADYATWRRGQGSVVERPRNFSSAEACGLVSRALASRGAGSLPAPEAARLVASLGLVVGPDRTAAAGGRPDQLRLVGLLVQDPTYGPLLSLQTAAGAPSSLRRVPPTPHAVCLLPLAAPDAAGVLEAAAGPDAGNRWPGALDALVRLGLLAEDAPELARGLFYLDCREGDGRAAATLELAEVRPWRTRPEWALRRLR
jgi:acyl-CoA synthetase (NDP forming)/RimJ/RimL family protein N-acetyltransferase